MSHPSVEQVARVMYESSNRGVGWVPWGQINTLPEWEYERTIWYARAAAVLALFEPETVTTAAEYDALPVGSVVRYLTDPDETGDRVAEKPDDLDTWVFVGSPGVFTSAQMAADGSPATVIHRGDDRG